MEKQNICVVGNGGWGTALISLLADLGHNTILWGIDPDYMADMRRTRRSPVFLPGIEIPENLALSSSLEECLPGRDMIILAVPTQFMRSVLEKMRDSLPADAPIVNVAKGIEMKTGMRCSEVIGDTLGPRDVASLSGPSHAEEVARRLPTTVVAASGNEALARRVQMTFMSERFRVYTSRDIIGVELGGALKNVIAVAAGACDGLKFGDNAKAALLTRGITEIARLGVAMGAKAATFFGLSGIGDLITTSYSPFGRNRRVGEQIGQGMTLDAILASSEQVAEGVWTSRAALAWAEKLNVDMPITREIVRVLFERRSPMQAVSELMLRNPKAEA